MKKICTRYLCTVIYIQIFTINEMQLDYIYNYCEINLLLIEPKINLGGRANCVWGRQSF